MRWPFDVSETLDYGKVCQTPAHLVEALQRHSVEDMVLFFEDACRDHTWIRLGGWETLHLLMAFFNRQYAGGQMELPLARRAAAAVQAHAPFLKEALDEDIECVLDGHHVAISSLLMGTESSVFSLMIAKRPSNTLVLHGLNVSHFLLAKEFCINGRLENLWKQSPEDILALMRFAEQWEIPALAQFAGDIFKRYLDKENLLDYFFMGEEQGIKALSTVCCAKFGDLDRGAFLKLDEKGLLHVDLHRFSDFTRVFLNRLASKIIYLRCFEPACEDVQLIDLLHHLDSLERFDLRETNAVAQQLPLHFPSVRLLDLGYTGWLRDEVFLTLLKCTPNLLELDISGSTELTFRAFGALGLLLSLKKVVCNFCKQISDEYADLLGASCFRVLDIHLEGCDQLGDKGVLSVARQCRSLRTLNVSKCDRLTDEGLIACVAEGKQLEKLELREVVGLTGEGMRQVALISDSLLEVDIRGCGIKAEELETLTKRNSKLRFVL